jgi:transcriptional regulator with PAS, ATPase and Fis domain
MDIRVIAATNRNLLKMVQEHNFRQDLYYRLNIMKLRLPSLAERREDIPLLINHFLRKLNLKKGKKIIGISDEVLDFLLSHPFLGNIRELENILEHAFILCRGRQIELEHLPKDLLQSNLNKANENHNTQMNQTLQETEAEIIVRTLRFFQSHRGKTAQTLGIDKSTLWRKMKRYGLI